MNPLPPTSLPGRRPVLRLLPFVALALGLGLGLPSRAGPAATPPSRPAAAGATPPAKKVALVVGNGAYAGNDRLKNPVADATLTAGSLRQLGFQTFLVTDRSTPQLKADLEAFRQAAQGADVALLFYAGHGIAVENINYLLPVDQRLSSLLSVDLKRQGISLRWVEALLQQANVAISVIVVDACRNTLMRSVPQQGMSAPPRPMRGTLTFYSTAPGALARDGSGGHSEFSAAFNRHLADPSLSLKRVLEATQRDVSAETAGTQMPWINSGLVGDLWLGATDKPSAPPVAVAANAATATAPGPARGDVAAAGGAPAVPGARFWNENLAELDEQVQFAVMNFDRSSEALLEQRAAAGDTLALTILGSVHAQPARASAAPRPKRPGEAAASPAPADAARAARYLARAAERRFPVAQTLLAELLIEAPRGVPRDLQRAENLLQDAAATGYGRARLDLLDLKRRRGTLAPQDMLDNATTLQEAIKRWQVPAR